MEITSSHIRRKVVRRKSFRRWATPFECCTNVDRLMDGFQSDGAAGETLPEKRGPGERVRAHVRQKLFQLFDGHDAERRNQVARFRHDERREEFILVLIHTEALRRRLVCYQHRQIRRG